MNVGLKGGETAVNATTIIHEFGHALGIYHEHQHPNNTLDLNETRILQDNGETSFDINYSKKTNNVITTPYDQKSVMHYYFESDELNSGPPIPVNNELSAGDKQLARKLYPRENAPSDFRWWRFPGSYSSNRLT